MNCTGNPEVLFRGHEILKCILNWNTISDIGQGSLDFRSLVQKTENKVKVKGQGHILNFDFGLFSLISINLIRYRQVIVTKLLVATCRNIIILVERVRRQ